MVQNKKVYIWSYLICFSLYLLGGYRAFQVVNDYLDYALIIPFYFKIYEIILLPFIIGFICNNIYKYRRLNLSNKMKDFLSINYAFILFFCLFSRNLLDDRAFNFDLYSAVREIPAYYDIYLFNVIMFLPLAFYRKMTFNIYITIVILIEIIQYITKLGVFDITDILFYILAFLIGKYIKHIFKNKILKENEK